MSDIETTPSKRNARMAIPIIDPVSDFRNAQEIRRAEALTEENTIKMQIESLEKQMLAQRRIIAGCDAALAATNGNGGEV